jgi:hypothetical protein
MSAPYAGGPAQPAAAAAGNWADNAPAAAPPHASYPNPDAAPTSRQQDWLPANAPQQPGQPGRPSQDASLYSTQYVLRLCVRLF